VLSEADTWAHHEWLLCTEQLLSFGWHGEWQWNLGVCSFEASNGDCWLFFWYSASVAKSVFTLAECVNLSLFCFIQLAFIRIVLLFLCYCLRWSIFLHSSQKLRLTNSIYPTFKILCFTMLFSRQDTPKVPITMVVSTSPSNTWFPGPIRLSISNCISIGSAIFAQLTAESH